MCECLQAGGIEGGKVEVGGRVPAEQAVEEELPGGVVVVETGDNQRAGAESCGEKEVEVGEALLVVGVDESDERLDPVEEAEALGGDDAAVRAGEVEVEQIDDPFGVAGMDRPLFDNERNLAEEPLVFGAQRAVRPGGEEEDGAAGECEIEGFGGEAVGEE